MKTMFDYTLYCTEEQTRKAFDLGAPLQYYYQDKKIVYIDNEGYMKIPTAEQMLGWIEDKMGLEINVIKSISIYYDYFVYKGITEIGRHGDAFNSRKEATLAAIDAALEYLTNNKK